MLRFQPDGWLEAVLRPFIMADPVAGVYVEFMAPDWRFAAAIVLFVIATLRTPSLWKKVAPGQLRIALSMVLMFALWTLTSGNGRYFIAALVLVGPLVILGVQLLEGSRPFRFSILALIAFVQIYAVCSTIAAGHWALTVWADNSEAIQPSGLRQKPGNFLTLTGISYSILVPWFHPDSRWANIAGQHQLGPSRLEYKALTELLSNKNRRNYVVLPEPIRELERPNAEAADLAASALGLHGLEFRTTDCVWLASRLVANATTDSHRKGTSGFWICPVSSKKERQAEALNEQRKLNRLHAEVFESLERSCPRIFRAGEGRNARLHGALVRFYTASDTRVMVDDKDYVYYKYFRAINYSPLASVDEVLSGEFRFPCDKIDGRYVLPWNR